MLHIIMTNWLFSDWCKSFDSRIKHLEIKLLDNGLDFDVIGNELGCNISHMILFY